MSLRDALLKAGKVSKKQARRAAAEERKKRKKKKGHRLEADRSDAAAARHADRVAIRADENRQRAEADRLRRLEREKALRITNLIRSWSRPVDSDRGRPFYFVRSSGSIGSVLVDRQTAWALEYGGLGLIEAPGRPARVHLVAEEGVRKLMALDVSGLRFYVGRDAPDDPLIAPALRPSAAAAVGVDTVSRGTTDA